MKEIEFRRLLLACLGMLVLFVRCSDKTEAETVLKVSAETLSLAAGGDTKVIYVKSTANFTLSSNQAWCRLSLASGVAGETTKIEVASDKNAANDDRTAIISVVSGGMEKLINVTQLKQAVLTFGQKSYIVAAAGGSISVPLQSTGGYEVAIGNNWISEPATKAVSSENRTFNIAANATLFGRMGTVIFSLGALRDTIHISQAASALNIPADKSGMTADAMPLSKSLGTGWNLGNALESTSATSASETLFGNPKTTKTLIDAVKKAGFNTVRIPCAWNAYIEDPATNKIRESWLARVKEVVDYCVDNNMYAILNIHWDGGWLEENANYSKQVAVNKKQKALWEQIAVYFRNYDEHLLFAGTNEVRSAANTPITESIAVQQSYLQTFVDAVRSTGGRNAWRNLVIQAFNTDITLADRHLTLSNDATPNRLMTEIHFYDPFEYSQLTQDQSWGTVKFYWGKEGGYAQYGAISSWGQEDLVRSQFALMKAKFTDHNIPVIMGEYAANYREVSDPAQQSNVNASRAYYLSYVTKQALANGIVPVYWDNGSTGNNGSGLFDRNTGTIMHADAVNAVIHPN